MTTRQIIEHLQGIYVRKHAIKILDLQGKMRAMNTEHDSIVQYIQELEEAHQKSARTGIPITDATLVMIATNAMLENQWFPTTN